MVNIRIATKDDIEYLMDIRLEMLKVVNGLSEEYVYSDEFVNECRDYFLNGDHITVLAMDDNMAIACKMVEYLIGKTWEKGVTEISLDATALGRPLYEKIGFIASTECMVLTSGK